MEKLPNVLTIVFRPFSDVFFVVGRRLRESDDVSTHTQVLGFGKGDIDPLQSEPLQIAHSLLDHILHFGIDPMEEDVRIDSHFQ
jgi:hypothetical protein